MISDFFFLINIYEHMYVFYVKWFEANSEIMFALIKEHNKPVKYRMYRLSLHGKSDSA